MTDNSKRKLGFGAAFFFFILGIIFWGGFNWAMEKTNTMEFCISCHEMRDNVYEEYTPTIHYSNRTGVRATCPDCHVPREWIHKVIRKIKASNELYHHFITKEVDTPEKFDAKRLELAKHVWRDMKSTDSRECRNCHNFESMNPAFQKPRARKQHLNAFETGQTCIDCHKGIAHKDVRMLLADEELEALESPNPNFKRDVPEMYKRGLELVAAREAEQAEKEKAEKKKAQEAAAAARKAEEERIQKAVAAALAAAGVASTESGTTEQPTAVPTHGEGFGIDWSTAGEREITIFYPGQTSIEWTLNGRDHGGARPFDKGGDRCVTCHDKETADMGKKMVTGEKAEETPIPGKRASIAVNVKAAHDNENLYLRFQWEDTEHVPVPFVEGGKMDPENPMKIAIMLATDEVEYADRAGCWGTCHHDAQGMPHAPDQAVLSASETAKRIDLAHGVTKYIKESRTKLEIKGRRGKKRGGWDKLKSAEEIQAELDVGHFMDLMRYSSGSGRTENGYILEQRHMSGGGEFQANARKEGNTWIVEMKRKLDTGKPGDVTIEPGKLYNFGFAIHDDHTLGRFHHVSLGYKLGLDNAEAEINAVGK
ncbi:MAG TPA: cytochrome C552 [Chromatiaceae bacterium]|nr:cytochrome C552 [Chromatiaceae bacterium]